MFPIRNTVATRYPPVVTWSLILANCVVFFIQIGLRPAELTEFLFYFALIPARYFEPLAYGEVPSTLLDYLPFFTMMFLHGGWLHLILTCGCCGCLVRRLKIVSVAALFLASISPAASRLR